MQEGVGIVKWLYYVKQQEIIKKVGMQVDGIVIYGSKYGTTKTYATELASRLAFDCKQYNDLKKVNMEQYQTVIYGGGLYAGGILGLKEALESCNHFRDKRFVLFTVGLADVTKPENISSIHKSVAAQLPTELLQEDNLFCLRGGIDYGKLTLGHKAMMKILYTKLKSMPEEHQSQENKDLISTYGKKVDFINLDAVGEIVAFINKDTASTKG